MMKSNNNNNEKKSYKVVLLGDAKCGKTSLINRYTKNIFNEDYVPTVFDSSSSEILLEKIDNMTIDLWDTSGSEEFDRLRPLSYEGVALFLLCFDLSNSESLSNITRKWYEEVKEYKTCVPTLLLGCKSDLIHHSHEKNKCLEIAKQVNAHAYFECSSKLSKDQSNIDRLFHVIALIITGRFHKIPKDVRVKRNQDKPRRCLLL